MTWTTEKPTEPGWYWVKTAKLIPEVAKVHESQFGRGLSISRAYNDEIDTIDEFIGCRRDVQWAGPIPMPEEA